MIAHSDTKHATETAFITQSDLRFGGVRKMKSIQLYVCEHCGTKYKDKNECKKCEGNHRAALEINDMRFHACKDTGNYPDKVELKMSDGKMIWYHR